MDITIRLCLLCWIIGKIPLTLHYWYISAIKLNATINQKFIGNEILLFGMIGQTIPVKIMMRRSIYIYWKTRRFPNLINCCVLLVSNTS